MTITLSWHNPEKTILLATFETAWNLVDYREMVKTGADWIKEQCHTVHVIYDFRKTKQSPHNLQLAGRYAEKQLPENQGLVIFVGADTVLTAFIAMGKRANLRATRNIHTVKTMDEAIRVIDYVGDTVN